MNKVPTMISTKDLAYISDIFEWNFNVNKELKHFEEEAKDADVKEQIKNLTTMHDNICNNLIKILKGE